MTATDTTPAVATGAVLAHVLRLGDNALVLGHRLGEWVGHAPELEEEMALANMGLDLIGQARALYTYAGELEGQGHDEDFFAYQRPEGAFRNFLLLEQPNEDFAVTMVRQLLYAAFALDLWTGLQGSRDERLAAIAAKSIKEVRYHFRHAAEWTIRLGDGTDLSHSKAQDALDDLWMWTGEMFELDPTEQPLVDAGIAIDPRPLRAGWLARLDPVLAEATLTRPPDGHMQSGGLQGRHTEHMGFILAELQYLQRAYPGLSW